MPSQQPVIGRELRTPPSPGRLVSWQGGVFLAALLTGIFLYMVYPEPPVTKGDIPPLVLFSEGKRSARIAFGLAGNTPRKMELLLSARLYLDVLLQVRPELEGMEDVYCVLGRVYYELGSLAAACPEAARRERLPAPEKFTLRALELLRKAMEMYPAGSAWGDEARVIAARCLLFLGRPAEVPGVLEPIVELVRERNVSYLKEERRQVLPWKEEVDLGPWPESALLAYARSLEEMGRGAEALAAVQEFIPVVNEPSRRQAMLSIAITESLSNRDRKAAATLLDGLEGPVLPEHAGLIAAAMLFTERYGKALSLLESQQSYPLPNFRRALMRSVALLGTGEESAAAETAGRIPPERLTPVERGVRWYVLARSAVEAANLADAVEFFSHLVRAAEGAQSGGDVLDYLLDVPLLSVLADEAVALLVEAGRRPEAAGLYLQLNGLLPEQDRKLLEKAAFLFEEAAYERHDPALWARAAEVLERILSSNPAGRYMETTLWRCIEDWQDAGEPLRIVLLCRRIYRDHPNLESTPKLLYTLVRLMGGLALYEDALWYADRLLTNYPRSTFSIEGRLDRARLHRRRGDFLKAREDYNAILRDARLGPDSLVYMMALHEIGLLEALLFERATASAEDAGKAMYSAAFEHLVEAVERYADPRFGDYPAFQEYISGKGGKRREVWEALVRLELLASLEDDPLGAARRIPQLVAAAREDTGPLGREKEGRFRMYEGIAYFVGAISARERGEEQSKRLFQRALEAFTEASERYQARPEGLFAKIAVVISLEHMGVPAERLARAYQDAEWAVQPLTGEQKQRARFWIEALDWLSQFRPEQGDMVKGIIND